MKDDYSKNEERRADLRRLNRTYSELVQTKGVSPDRIAAVRRARADLQLEILRFERAVDGYE